MFFSQPKIKRIALHLESTLSEICRSSWAFYLTTVPSAESIEYADHLDENLDLDKIFETPSLYRGKEHFPWIIVPDDGLNREYERINACMQYQFYSQLLKDAQAINKELDEVSPDYKSIIRLAKHINRSTVDIPSINSDETISFSVDATFGGNLFTDFLSVHWVLFMQ